MPSTRRDVLRAAAGLTSLALAGCQSLPGGGTPTENPRTDPVTDYAVATLRRSDGTPYRYTGGDDATPQSLVVGSSDDLDDVSIAGSESEHAHFRSFLEATDFSNWSVLLSRRQIGACDEQRVESVWRRPGSLSVTLCREPRPADVTCSTDEEVDVAIAIRVPFTADQYDRPTVGTSSECTGRMGPRPTAEGE